MRENNLRTHINHAGRINAMPRNAAKSRPPTLDTDSWRL